MLDDFLIHVFHKGNTLEAYKIFGAHLETNNHKKGVRFTFDEAPWGHEWQFWRLQLAEFVQKLFFPII